MTHRIQRMSIVVCRSRRNLHLVSLVLKRYLSYCCQFHGRKFSANVNMSNYLPTSIWSVILWYGKAGHQFYIFGRKSERGWIGKIIFVVPPSRINQYRISNHFWSLKALNFFYFWLFQQNQLIFFSNFFEKFELPLHFIMNLKWV